MVESTPMITFQGYIFLIVLVIFIYALWSWSSKKNKEKNIEEEAKTWKNLDNLLDLKKYQYNQLFVFVFGIMAVIILGIQLFFNYYDKTTPQLGWVPLIIMTIVMGAGLIYLIFTLMRGMNISNRHIEFLLRKKDKTLNKFYQHFLEPYKKMSYNGLCNWKHVWSLLFFLVLLMFFIFRPYNWYILDIFDKLIIIIVAISIVWVFIFRYLSNYRYRIIKVHFIVLFILLFIFFIANFHFNSINLGHGEKQQYDFQLTTNPNNAWHIYSILITYDFGNELGSINFGISEGPTDRDEYPIQIIIPKNLTITEITFQENSTSKLIEGQDFKRENAEDKESHVMLSNFKIKNLENHKARINFKGYLIPNATISFDFNSLGSNAQTNSGEFFNIKIGDYSCDFIEKCIDSDKDVYGRYYYGWKDYGNLLKIYRIKNFGGCNDCIQDEDFNIHLGPNKNLKSQKDMWGEIRYILLSIVLSFVLINIIKSLLSKEPL